jgi:hypothetical protein
LHGNKTGVTCRNCIEISEGESSWGGLMILRQSRDVSKIEQFPLLKNVMFLAGFAQVKP